MKSQMTCEFSRSTQLLIVLFGKIMYTSFLNNNTISVSVSMIADQYIIPERQRKIL